MKIESQVVSPIVAILGIVCLSSMATAQLVAPEPRECSNARQLRAAGRNAEALRWQRACNAALSAATRAPGAPRSAFGLPPAAPPAATAPAPARPAPAPNWANELPSVDAVRNAVGGHGTHDTAVRRSAAFALLMDYANILSGGSRVDSRAPQQYMSPTAFARWSEYSKARDVELGSVLAGTSGAQDLQIRAEMNDHAGDLAFSREVLGKLVAKASEDAFETASADWFKENEIIRAKSGRAAPEAPADAAGQAAHPTTPPSPREFPSVATVKQKITVVLDPQETARRQYGAFRALRELAMDTYGPDLPAELKKQCVEYEQAAAMIKISGVFAPPQHVPRELSRNFRIEALGAFFSVDFVRQYADKKEAAFASRDAELKRGIEESTRKLAAGEHTVFGIALGEKLNLPRCTDDMSLSDIMQATTGVGRGGSETCVGDKTADFSMGLAGLVLGMTGLRDPTTTVADFVSARLADNMCPAWVRLGGGCYVILAVKEDYVLGATIVPGAAPEQQTKIHDELVKKYGAPTGRGQSTECRNTLTGIKTAEAEGLTWSRPGLQISYTPIVSDCKRGRITVELDYLKKLQDRALKAQEAAEPKL